MPLTSKIRLVSLTRRSHFQRVVNLFVRGGPAARERTAYSHVALEVLDLSLGWGDDCRWMAGAESNKVCKLQFSFK